MRCSGEHGRRAWTARFVVMALFVAAVMTVSLSGMMGGHANAQTVALTPWAYLSLVGNNSTMSGQPSTPTPEPTAPPDSYDQVHLAWVSEPSTTLTVVWRTPDSATASAVRYREVGAPSWQTAAGGVRPSGTAGTLHEVTLAGLRPGTEYEYRVQAPGGWSAPFTARTAPPPGPATFDAVFLADTGLVGRLDGLATGTQQVIDEIGEMKPLLLLGGGDYAYFDKDKRYETLDNTIDAWFNQMQPLAAHAALMPTYGNHEIDPSLGEAFEPWAARFATPDGFDNRKNYSFDVGDVHFISIFAPVDYSGVSDEQIAWLENDIVAAKTRGMRWIIPYFHVVMFGDGDNHEWNPMLRADLGPVFERHGVKLALYAHDQAYERSYPLVDVPGSNTPSSNSLTCYTPQDGVVYMKISPSGKQSNISGGFSPFKTQAKPGWTAVRDNTMHHFARLRVSAEGSITVEAWGIEPNGTAFTLNDSFKITTGTCP